MQFAALHDVDGLDVGTQGFNVFGSLDKASCAGDDAAPGNIYCLGKYKDDATNDANLAASYVSEIRNDVEEWVLAVQDAKHARTGWQGVVQPGPI